MSKPNDSALDFPVKAILLEVPCYRWKCTCGYINLTPVAEQLKKKPQTEDNCLMCGLKVKLNHKTLRS